MDKPRIEKIDARQIEKLQKIGKQTFFETFADSNTSEDMEKYLTNSFAKSKLIQELNNPNSCFYLAKLNSRIVGYLKVNWSDAQTEPQEPGAFEIERIYVLNKFHGKKIGQSLFKKALNIAESKNSKYLWLGVWEKNPRAIRFYQKNGFVAYDKHTFIVGNDKQTDVLMKRTI
ncbi:MAG: GNAT family N-acetyltransferase [Marinicellaceae bacterium]